MKSSKVFKTVASIVLVLTMVLTSVVVQSTTTSAAAKPVLNKKTVNSTVGLDTKVVVKNYIKGSTYVWSTKSSKIATVTADTAKPIKGYVKGVKAGNTTLTCKVTTPTGAKYTLSVPVKVAAVVTSVSISNKKDLKTLSAGKSATIKLTVKPSATNQVIKYSSSKSSVATVSSTGVVKAVAAGTATITCTVGAKKTSTKVTVAKGASGNVVWEMTPQDEGYGANGIECLYTTYKYSWGAIWLCNATFDDYVGKTVNIKGKFKFTGTNSYLEVIAQLNYTQPEAYPVIGKVENVNPNTWYDVDFSFAIPADAKNGDTDEDTGENYPIMMYFASKPNDQFIYKTGTDFYFKDFVITSK